MSGILPTCTCGTCRLCMQRVVKKHYYQRHAKQVYERVKAYRVIHPRRKTPITDEELDRRAIARWRPEWGPV